MRHILIFVFLCLFPLCGMTQETGETCADGGGNVILGTITKKKYCMSKTTMNWWNAYAWCDGLNLRMIDLNKDCPNSCSELKFGTDSFIWWSWTANPYSDTQMRAYFTDSGSQYHYKKDADGIALCSDILPDLGNMD